MICVSFIADSYVRHPNSYLPTHGYNIPSEQDGDCLHSPGADSDDVEPYGFPSNRNRRKHCDEDIGSVITTLGNDSIERNQFNCSKLWVCNVIYEHFQMSDIRY